MMINNKPGVLSALVVAIASASLAGCGGSGGSASAGGSTPSSAVAETTSTSAAVVTLNGGVGGDGASSTGGDGGYFELYKESGAGDVKVLASGAAAAGFVSKTFTPEFGDNAVVVTASKTVTEYADCTAANAATENTLYLVSGNNKLYKADADGAGCEGEEQVTGLKVNAGVTLTLPTNSGSAAYVDFDKDVQNLGTITTADESASLRGSIWLYGQSYIGSGKILTKGTADGQSGGDIYTEFDYAFINNGEFNSSGANSAAADGGDAGYIDLEAGYYVQNRGALKAKGGDSAADAGGTGGDADYIEFYSYSGPALNSGAIDGRGGKGDTGGDGASLYFYGDFGKAHNTGAIWLQGADSTVGNGGDGGYAYFESYGGTLRNSGAVLIYGGKTTDVTGSGGNGGSLDVYSYDSGQYEYTPAGSINWSGRIALNGGNAVQTGDGSGGDAGDVYAELYNDYTADADIVFMGYSQVHTFGGAGANGGYASSYELYNYDVSQYESETGYYRTNQGGNIVSQASIKANGGGAYTTSARTNAVGGEGGYFGLETDYNSEDMSDLSRSKITHSGAVNLNGGQNKDSNATGWSNGGRGGSMWVWGYNGVTFTGAITANGGNDVGTTGGTSNTTSNGGMAAYVEIWGELGTTRVTGNISSNGGNGAYRGGNAGDWSDVSIWGNKVVQSGTLSHKGGDADPDVAGSTGGNGGWIELKATNRDESTGTTSGNYGGGTGVNAGNEGGFQNFVSCTGDWC